MRPRRVGDRHAGEDDLDPLGHRLDARRARVVGDRFHLDTVPQDGEWRGRPGVRQLGEALTVWAIYGLEAIAVLVTYSRLPPEVLYNVDSAGDLAGGLSRMVTVLNYPLALGAITLAAVAGGRARSSGCRLRFALWSLYRASSTRMTSMPAGSTRCPCSASCSRLRSRLGPRGGDGSFVRRARGDRLRLVLRAALLLLTLPWVAAEAGSYFPGDVFLGEEVPPVRDPGLAAVHLGFHHGTGGVLLALTALLLSRIPAGRALRGYLSLMLAYGLANALQDGWNEQLWKRGTVDTHPERAPSGSHLALARDRARRRGGLRALVSPSAQHPGTRVSLCFRNTSLRPRA